MNITKLMTVFVFAFSFIVPSMTMAEDHSINAEARAFKPDIIYIAPGDTAKFRNMTSHNSKSMIIPEGAEGWESKLGENIGVTLEKEGIYGYVCVPHIGFGMVGVIVVGTPTQEMKDAAMKTAMDTLEGPFRRLIGKLKKVQVK